MALLPRGGRAYRPASWSAFDWHAGELDVEALAVLMRPCSPYFGPVSLVAFAFDHMNRVRLLLLVRLHRTISRLFCQLRQSRPDGSAQGQEVRATAQGGSGRGPSGIRLDALRRAPSTESPLKPERKPIEDDFKLAGCEVSPVLRTMVVQRSS